MKKYSPMEIVAMKLQEIGKDKFKKIFLDGFDPENMESILEQFAKIEENIIKYIGNFSANRYLYNHWIFNITANG